VEWNLVDCLSDPLAGSVPSVLAMEVLELVAWYLGHLWYCSGAVCRVANLKHVTVDIAFESLSVHCNGC